MPEKNGAWFTLDASRAASQWKLCFGIDSVSNATHSASSAHPALLDVVSVNEWDYCARGDAIVSGGRDSLMTIS